MFKASNNEAECEGLISGIELRYMAEATLVRANSDSQLVFSQLNGEYGAKDGTIAAYVRRVHEATGQLQQFLIACIPRLENHQADSLSKLASSLADGKLNRIQWEALLERSIEPREVLLRNIWSRWMEPIKAYLAEGTMPTNT